jgi:hypothetical protein
MLTDVLALAGLLVCFWIGSTVHDATEELAGPGRSIESAGNDLAERLDEAANAADDIPAVGDELAAPLDRARDVGEQIESAGARQQEVVATLADVLGPDARRRPLHSGCSCGGCRRECGSRGALTRPRSCGSPLPASTCWRCARWPVSRCAS